MRIFKILEHNDLELVDSIWVELEDSLKCVSPSKSKYTPGFVVKSEIILEGLRLSVDLDLVLG